VLTVFCQCDERERAYGWPLTILYTALSYKEKMFQASSHCGIGKSGEDRYPNMRRSMDLVGVQIHVTLFFGLWKP
jgi:hypothetical protein